MGGAPTDTAGALRGGCLQHGRCREGSVQVWCRDADAPNKNQMKHGLKLSSFYLLRVLEAKINWPASVEESVSGLLRRSW